MNKFTILTVSLSLFTNIIIAQNENTKSFEDQSDNKVLNWYNKSPVEDLIYGAEVDKTYDILIKDRKSTTIIVAVIDGGIDINHEDLKSNIWINKDEIPNNNIDDDNNGYIDDIHGWNFIGNDKGENITYENLEITRIVKEYKDKYLGVKVSSLSDKDKKEYQLYKKAKKYYDKELKFATRQKTYLERFKNRYYEVKNNIEYELNGKELNIENLDSLKENNRKFKKDIKFLYPFVKYSVGLEIFDEVETYVTEELDYHLNLEYNPRKIIGDNIIDISDYYGNNNVYGPEADHGTFVAGIIAAERNNEIGINGIASDVKIMALKAVPNGDERDKDIAKAIYYAVDNGARIINMSFGKELSPQKYLVDEAIIYAEKKGVLIVHASGNEAVNLDKIESYPSKVITENQSVSNWITVGASAMNADRYFASDFSNYGQNMVDIFAPGVQIKSLKPENEYEIADGTSFSAPVVSGVAALLLSYFPELDYKELKDIILQSAIQYPDLKVYKPTEKRRSSKIKFKKLSKTGGIVSAYKAFKLAEQVSNN